MGRTAYTEPQCLYKGGLYLYLLYTLRVNLKFISNGRTFGQEMLNLEFEQKTCL